MSDYELFGVENLTPANLALLVVVLMWLMWLGKRS